MAYTDLLGWAAGDRNAQLELVWQKVKETALGSGSNLFQSRRKSEIINQNCVSWRYRDH